MKRETLSAEKRTVLGKKVKKLRREGILPANVYGQSHKSIAIQMPIKDFSPVFRKSGETGLVDLSFEKETLPVLIHSVQREPRSQEVIHVDFLVVNLKEKITTKVPVVAIGEPLAVKDKLGILISVLSELEIEALPADLPEKIEVPVEELAAVGDHVLVSDIKGVSSFTITADPAQVVFKIDELVQKVEEPEPEAAEGETTEEGAATEEEASSGDDAAPAAETSEDTSE